MTLRSIHTIDEANRYLDTYLSAHNKRFAVKAKEQEDLHREIPKGLNLDKVLCIRTVRTLRNDFTVAHNSRLYQIEKGVSSKKVTVEERVNGSMLITHHDVRLPFREITARPEKAKAPTHVRWHKKHTPSVDHPWNKSNQRLFRQMRGQGKKPLEVATL
jgi:hypothetical protein